MAILQKKEKEVKELVRDLLVVLERFEGVINEALLTKSLPVNVHTTKDFPDLLISVIRNRIEAAGYTVKYYSTHTDGNYFNIS